ncbi:hypothetical protein [Candidatus Palauibacter sp.]|uniref:hypothetical protein n=1 Tax=Candidatus Palauibacter sp. TaxID=3101350 RepID=UPI003AF21D29
MSTGYCEDDTCETLPVLGFDAGEQWGADAGGSGTSSDMGRGSCTTYLCEDARPARGRPFLADPPAPDVADPVEHPLFASLPGETDPKLGTDTVPPASWSSSLSSRWRSLRDAITGAEPGASIDLAGGAGRSTSRRILDVELDHAGTVYVLHTHPRRSPIRRVEAYDSSGRLVGQVDREGDAGQGLRVPRAMALLDDSRLAVVQQYGDVAVFSRTEDGFVLDAGRPVNLPASDICGEQGRIYVTQRRSPRAIHELESGPRRQGRSFGSVYEHGSGLARNALSEGILACLEDPARVVFGFRAIPRLDAYEAGSGERIWTAGVTDYTQGVFVEQVRPRHGITSPVNYPRERLARLLPVSPEFLVAVYTRSHTEPEAGVETRTYLLHSATGQGAMISDTLSIIGAIRDDTYVTVGGATGAMIQFRYMRPGG